MLDVFPEHFVEGSCATSHHTVKEPSACVCKEKLGAELLFGH